MGKFPNLTSRQIHRFVSWKPDPKCIAIDGLRFPLTDENARCSPPEALISSLLAKIAREQATITLEVPSVAQQAALARAARSSDRQARHPRAAGRLSGNDRAKHVFRVSASETSYLADIRVALEDCEVPDSARSLMISGLSKYSNWRVSSTGVLSRAAWYGAVLLLKTLIPMQMQINLKHTSATFVIPRPQQWAVTALCAIIGQQSMLLL